MDPLHMQKHIAIVDDDPLIADLIEAILKPLELPIDTFGSAGELTACAHVTKYRTIFVDLSLADMDGLDLITMIANTSPDVHIVIVSGHKREVLISAKWHARMCGIKACDVVIKPFTRQDLYRVMRQTDPLAGL